MLGLQKISGIMKTEYPRFSPFRTYSVPFCPADGTEWAFHFDTSYFRFVESIFVSTSTMIFK